MTSLLANQQPVFYKLYEGQEEIIDMDGNVTGNYFPIYGPIKSAMLCVSPNKGSTETEQFGTLMDYDRTMTTADVGCEIDENAVLWVDGADTAGPYNAIVKLRAVWKNSVQYAIKHVTVSEYVQEQQRLDRLRRMKSQAEAAHEDKAETK